MNQRNVGKALTAFGIAILLYALNMSVSVKGSDFVNVNMMSERQNATIIGGFVFLAGVILFALARAEQSKTQDRYGNALNASRHEKLRGTAVLLLTSVKSFFVGTRYGWGSIFLRLVLAVGVTGLAAPYLDRLVVSALGSGIDYELAFQWRGYAADIFFLFMMVYSLRNRPTLDTFQVMLALSLPIVLIPFVDVVVIQGSYFGESMMTMMNMVPVIWVLGLLVILVTKRCRRVRN